MTSLKQERRQSNNIIFIFDKHSVKRFNKALIHSRVSSEKPTPRKSKPVEHFFHHYAEKLSVVRVAHSGGRRKDPQVPMLAARGIYRKTYSNMTSVTRALPGPWK